MYILVEPCVCYNERHIEESNYLLVNHYKFTHTVRFSTDIYIVGIRSLKNIIENYSILTDK